MCVILRAQPWLKAVALTDGPEIKITPRVASPLVSLTEFPNLISAR